APATAGTGDAKRPWGWLAALAVGLALAAPAWGVVVDVTVTGPDGEPVAGATVDLGFGPPVTTDEDGTATLDVPDEEMGREVDGFVSYHDPDGNPVRVPVRVRLVPNTRIPLEPRDPAGPPDPPPARDFACRNLGGALRLAFGVGRMKLDDMHLDELSFDVAQLVNGNEVNRNTGSASEAEVDDSNRRQEKPTEVDTQGGGVIQIPLRPGVCAMGGSFIPSVKLIADFVDLLFESRDPEPGQSQSFAGDGWRYGGGLNATILKPSKRWSLNAGAEYLQTEKLKVRRSVGVGENFGPPGSITLRDDATFKQESTSVQVTVGFAGDRVVAHAGPGYTWDQATLETDSSIDITSAFPGAPPGTVVVQDQKIRNLFRDDYPELVAGVIAKLVGPVAIQADARVSEDSYSLEMYFAIALTR
ncbi:MAG TPA: hypothetical protein VMV46_16820, partial [Thermoanaerobaculia bacterium]|nr:hypothetical protein [Thermoanaerobaculia bacterium]